MKCNLLHSERLHAITLIFVGGAAIIIAVSPELVGRGGQPGFSVKQISLAAIGAISILNGVVVASPAARRYIESCLTTVSLYERLTVTRLVLISIWFGLLAGLGRSLDSRLPKIRSPVAPATRESKYILDGTASGDCCRNCFRTVLSPYSTAMAKPFSASHRSFCLPASLGSEPVANVPDADSYPGGASASCRLGD